MGNKGSGRLLSNDSHWFIRALKVGIITFALAIFIGLPAQRVAKSFSLLVSIPVLLLIVLIGVVADVVGVASAAADEAPVNAMAAKKVRGAKQALKLIRNADKVTSVMNDIVGDLCGTIGGGVAAALVFSIAALHQGINREITGALAIGLVAGLTVGAKAAGKKFAISQANEIIRLCGRILYDFERITGLNILNNGKGSQRKNGR